MYLNLSVSYSYSSIRYFEKFMSKTFNCIIFSFRFVQSMNPKCLFLPFNFCKRYHKISKTARFLHVVSIVTKCRSEVLAVIRNAK